MNLTIIAQITGAALLLAVGVMLVAVGSLVGGLLAVAGGGAWLVRTLRTL